MKKLILLVFILFSGLYPLKSENKPGSLPKMKKAEKAVYVAISNDSPEAKHACRILQGIINRKTADIFLANGDSELEWFKYIDVPYTRPPHIINTGNNQGLRTLFKNYKDHIDKLVVCNFITNDYTFNMAVNMACIENALPVSEKLKNELVEEFGWDKEIVDIRNRWNNIAEAYDWALENQMPEMDKQIIFSTGLRDDWKNGGWEIYDYAVATRSFTFWLDDKTEEGRTIIHKILNTPGYPKNSYTLGYGMHGDELNHTINKDGFGLLVSDLFPNASFYSSFPSESFAQAQREGIAVPAEKNKIYVALHWSDGDNIQFNHNGAKGIFNQEDRGSVPVSMTLSPALMDIAPFILRYYYEKATDNDEMIGGPSGVQYIQEASYKPSDYESWCEMNGEWLREAGMYSTASSLPWPAKPFLNNGFTKTNVTGTLAWTDGRYMDAYNWAGMPVICVGGVVGPEEQLYSYLSRLAASPERPVFTGVYLVQALFGSAGYPAIKKITEQLQTEFPEKFVFLRTSDLTATAKAYFESVQKPFKSLEIPGRIEAEDFDEGGQGAGFYDTAKNNEGGKYRTGKDIYPGIDSGGTGYYVGWTNGGEWMNYTMEIKEEGVYDITINYSSPGSDPSLCLILDNQVLASVEMKGSENYDTYKDKTVKAYLPQGKHVFKIWFNAGNVNLDYIDFAKTDEEVPEITSGKVYKITAKHSGKVLALQTDDQQAGASIVQQAYEEKERQLWQIDIAGEAYYSLKSMASELSVIRKESGDVQQYPFDCMADEGKWNLIYVGNGYFNIQPKRSLKMLGISESSMTENALVKTMDISDSDNQLFELKEVNYITSIPENPYTNYQLHAYPNPFTDLVTISIELEQAQQMVISVYSISGIIIYQRNVFLNSGLNNIQWDGCSSNGAKVPPGFYVYSINGKTCNASGRLIKTQ